MIRIFLTICLLCLPCFAYDINADGSCDMLDFAEVAKGWGGKYNMDDLLKLSSNFANPNYTQEQYESVDWSLFSLSDRQFFIDNFPYLLYFSDYLGYETIQSFLFYMTDYTSASFSNEYDFTWFDLINFGDYQESYTLNSVQSSFGTDEYLKYVLTEPFIPVYSRCLFHFPVDVDRYSYDSLGFLTVGLVMIPNSYDADYNVIGYQSFRTLFFIPRVVSGVTFRGSVNNPYFFLYFDAYRNFLLTGTRFGYITDFPSPYYNDSNYVFRPFDTTYAYFLHYPIGPSSYQYIPFLPLPFLDCYSISSLNSDGSSPLKFHPKILTSYSIELERYFTWNFSDYDLYSDFYAQNDLTSGIDVLSFNDNWNLSGFTDLTSTSPSFVIPLSSSGVVSDVTVDFDDSIVDLDFLASCSRTLCRFLIVFIAVSRAFIVLTDTKDSVPDEVSMRIIVLVLIILAFIPSFVFADTTVPVDPNDENSNQSGFWFDVFWGTAEDPGIFRSMFQWFIDFIDDFYGGLIDLVISSFDISPESYDDIKYVFEIAERWLPISFAFRTIFAYWVFLSVFCGVKFLLKCIPFIG